jgi:asparagine synthase (glutamine-hydrolysing)
MCGIAGLWMRGGAGSAELAAAAQSMAALLRHRGPDAQATFVDEAAGLAFGQTRLAIMDLSPAGALPMSSADGRFVIAYNGEVYETGPLRADLERRGVRFRGHSDTEVIVEACAHFGVETTLPRLVGMFVFALWDRHERRLVLVRDRFGIKPLYFAQRGDSFVFGSELKAFFAAPGFRGEIDRDALADYLRFSYVPAPRSIFRDVAKLPPGHLLVAEQNGAARQQRWWDMRPLVVAGLERPLTLSPGEAEDQLDRLLRQAVGSRMIADVPLGAFLSGGIDSSTVVAQMQAQASLPVRTFTIGFSQPDYDESRNAAAVARHLGTEHTAIELAPADAMAVIPKLPDIYDEPFADSSQIPTFLVSRLARTGVTVALSGDGGDELFAGYNRYRWGERLGRAIGLVPAPLRRAFASALAAVPPSIWNKFGVLPGVARHPEIAVAKLTEVLRLAGHDDLYRRLVSAWTDPERLIPDAKPDWRLLADPEVAAAIPPLLERMQYLDALTYLPDDILTKVDRASMAVGLEARVPLLDHRVAAFAFSLPRSLRLQGTTGKVLLRRVLARYVPRRLFERAKTGFGIPVGAWLRGPLRDWAESLLTPAALAEGGLTAEPVRDVWTKHLDGRLDGESRLWTVLMYQAWRVRWCSR